MEADTAIRSAERRFRVMGSDAHLIVVGHHDHHVGEARLDLGEQVLRELEARWSRFLPTSDVSVLNASAGHAVRVDPTTVLLVERAIAAWRLSGASFDPTLLHELTSAGYDRSFEQLAASTDATSEPCHRARRRTPGLRLVDCNDIVIEGTTVRLPPGIGFDAGGIGKGLAADLVAAELLLAGATGVCVNVGGDLRVSGASPTGSAWTLAIEHPSLDAPLALVGLRSGAIATSTTLQRRWHVDGELRHHLIDPETGEPSTSDLVLVSVIATEAWTAEVLAKAILLRGAARAFDLVDTKVAQALTVDVHGTVRTTSGWDRFAGSTTRSTTRPATTKAATTATPRPLEGARS